MLDLSFGALHHGDVSRIFERGAFACDESMCDADGGAILDQDPTMIITETQHEHFDDVARGDGDDDDDPVA